MTKPREIVVHQSANRPNLLLGGDRELVLLAAMMAASLVFVIATFWGVMLGFGLWAGSVAVLKRMGKADPLLRHVYVRHVRYQPFYLAKSHVNSRPYETPAAWR